MLEYPGQPVPLQVFPLGSNLGRTYLECQTTYQKRTAENDGLVGEAFQVDPGCRFCQFQVISWECKSRVVRCVNAGAELLRWSAQK